MSRKIPKQEYEKTLSFRLSRWLNGENDTFVGKVEMQPQEEPYEDDSVVMNRKKERKQRMERIYDLANNWEVSGFEKLYKIFSAFFCLFIVAMLLIAVSYLPSYGHAENPVNNEVAERYIESGLEETGAVNIVTGMILDYRAFDTFGESNVLFIATCTVLILMRNDKKKGKGSAEDEERRDSFYEPKKDAILQMAARILVPVIMIFGIYIILNGHLSPGGGFSGGAIIGAGLILYLNAFGFEKTERFFTEKTYKAVSFGALLFYCLAKSYSFYTGAHHLESGISLGTPGAIISSGLILPLNICVGLVVACTMYAFFALFRKGGF